MSIVVPVVEVRRDGTTDGRGEHEFAAIPSPGDRVVLSGPMGDLDIMKVLYAEHSPVELPRGSVTQDQQPSIMLYVEFLERFSG